MAKKYWVLVVFCNLFILSSNAQDNLFKPVTFDTSKLRIVFAGDMMGHIPLVNSCLTSDGTYNYDPIFNYVKPYFVNVDFAIANLEVPLAGRPYAGYPQFSSPDAVAIGLKHTGFNVLITANNHALDRGKQGFERTIQALDSIGIKHTGTFRTSDEKQLNHPLYIEKNNIKVAILNYTYGTNGFKIDLPDIINYIDTAEIRRDVVTSRENHADFIIVTLHWGTEYERYPNLEQRKIAEFIRSIGADAVIGAHSHVIQTIERFSNLHNPTDLFPVVFSMGNFVSNQRERYKDGGIMVELDLEKAHNTKLKSCSYLPVWVYKGIYEGKMVYRLFTPDKYVEASTFYNLSDSNKFKAQQFFDDTKLHLNNIEMMEKRELIGKENN